jgi:acylphosphatase
VESERLHAVITGDVQGVGFRFFLIRHAQALDLRGWVRNRDDGAVELVAEGPRLDLEQLLFYAKQGPRQARVSHVDAGWSVASGGLDLFDISAGGGEVGTI